MNTPRTFHTMCQFLGITPTFQGAVYLDLLLPSMVKSMEKDFIGFVYMACGLTADKLEEAMKTINSGFDIANPTKEQILVTSATVLGAVYCGTIMGFIAPPTDERWFDKLFNNYRTGRIPKTVHNNVDNILATSAREARGGADPMEGMSL